MAVPRAFVIAAGSFDSRRVNPLPKLIRTPHSVALIFSQRGHLPIKVARQESGARKIDYVYVRVYPTFSGAMPELSVPDSEQALPIPKRYSTESRKGVITKKSIEVNLGGGLRYYPHYPSFDRYEYDGGGHHKAVTCLTHLKDARPGMKCRHYVLLNNALYASIVLPDFRASGGFENAHKNVLEARRFLCDFIECT